MQEKLWIIKHKLLRIIKFIYRNFRKTYNFLFQKISLIIKKIKISKILIYLFLTLSLICLFLYNYINDNFYNVTIDQLLFSVQMSEGTSNSVILEGTKYIIIRLFIVYLILFVVCFIVKILRKKHTKLVLYIRNKKINLSIVPFSNIIKVFACFILLLSSLYYCANEFEVFAYIDNNTKQTENEDFFKKYYVDRRGINLTAPEEKQNLIYIYVESLESSMVTEKNNGAFNKKVIPNLEKIAKNNINFSNNDKIGGAYMPYGNSWTIAGMVGSTSGIPLKLSSVGGNEYSGYGEFLPGAYTLGDILDENGYNNYLFIGSDAAFGGREDYFTYHGDYNIYDYNYAINQGWIDEDYYVWWGYEDGKLFDFAKDTLKDISKEDEPFNFTLLTTDTHFTDGYVEESCETPFDEQYLNAYHCSDELINKFINWIKKQDFYENTTIVITGDHLTMQADMHQMFDISNKEDYERTIYNAIINSKTTTETTKNRIFTTYDFYPTVLASLGFKIEGDRLGLGTNLFSTMPTIAEELGIKELDAKLKQNSDFYEKHFLNNLNKKVEEKISASASTSSVSNTES